MKKRGVGASRDITVLLILSIRDNLGSCPVFTNNVAWHRPLSHVACRVRLSPVAPVSPDAFWATPERTCWAGWSWGVVVEGVGDDRRSDWSSCGCAAQVGEDANLAYPRLATMETLRGSGAFCHWEACLAWNAASGKRFPTPAGRAVACRLVSPTAFLATRVESG
jgi:hypothetical protein